MVTASTDIQTDLSKVVHPSRRSICQLSEPQTSTVHVSSPSPKCLRHNLRLARDALVLGPSAALNRDPTSATSVSISSQTVPQLQSTTSQPLRLLSSISLTMRDRAISSKFSIHRVSQQSTLANFVQVLEQNSCFPLGGHYACQCVLFLVFNPSP